MTDRRKFRCWCRARDCRHQSLHSAFRQTRCSTGTRTLPRFDDGMREKEESRGGAEDVEKCVRNQWNMRHLEWCDARCSFCNAERSLGTLMSSPASFNGNSIRSSSSSNRNGTGIIIIITMTNVTTEPCTPRTWPDRQTDGWPDVLNAMSAGALRFHQTIQH